VSATGNSYPEASFTWSPESPATGDTVTLDGSGSSDFDGDSLEYRWDTNGDGTWDMAYSETETIKTTFGSTGSYDVRLQVTDGEDSGTTTRTIDVQQ
jgi:hypothetical protein